MKPARILLLIVAIVAGGLAAFLATRGDQPQPQVAQTKVVEAPQTRVLIASHNIGIGQRLNSNVVEWHNWPNSAVRADYVTAKTMPDAIKTMSGTVARFEVFAGEPITGAKLVRSDQGYLSAVIAEGMRAVSIPVTPASGAGGFIIPDDRVDVVLTRRTSGGDVSSTILSNVRVLAIGKSLGDAGNASNDSSNKANTGFDRSTIATFELDPGQAETIINAAAIGKISLVLRSVADFGGNASGASERASGSVTVIRFGQPSSVQSGATDAAPVEVNPASYSQPSGSNGSGSAGAPADTSAAPSGPAPATPQ